MSFQKKKFHTHKENALPTYNEQQMFADLRINFTIINQCILEPQIFISYADKLQQISILKLYLSDEIFFCPLSDLFTLRNINMTKLISTIQFEGLIQTLLLKLKVFDEVILSELEKYLDERINNKTAYLDKQVTYQAYQYREKLLFSMKSKLLHNSLRVIQLYNKASKKKQQLKVSKSHPNYIISQEDLYLKDYLMEQLQKLRAGQTKQQLQRCNYIQKNKNKLVPKQSYHEFTQKILYYYHTADQSMTKYINHAHNPQRKKNTSYQQNTAAASEFPPSAEFLKSVNQNVCRSEMKKSLPSTVGSEQDNQIKRQPAPVQSNHAYNTQKSDNSLNKLAVSSQWSTVITLISTERETSSSKSVNKSVYLFKINKSQPSTVGSEYDNKNTKQKKQSIISEKKSYQNMQIENVKISAIQRPVSVRCLNCVQYFYKGLPVQIQRNHLVSYVILNSIKMIKDSQDTIRQYIGIIVNEGGGTILFGCNRIKFGFVPFGESVKLKEQQSYIASFEHLMKCIVPQSYQKLIDYKIDFIPLKQNPKFVNGRLVESNNIKQIERYFVPELYVMRVKLNPKSGKQLFGCKIDQRTYYMTREKGNIIEFRTKSDIQKEIKRRNNRYSQIKKIEDLEQLREQLEQDEYQQFIRGRRQVLLNAHEGKCLETLTLSN